MLTDLQTEILNFESTAPTQAERQAFAGRKGMREPGYMQILNALIDNPESLKLDAVTVNRLRRVREERQAARMPR